MYLEIIFWIQIYRHAGTYIPNQKVFLKEQSSLFGKAFNLRGNLEFYVWLKMARVSDLSDRCLNISDIETLNR